MNRKIFLAIAIVLLLAIVFVGLFRKKTGSPVLTSPAESQSQSQQPVTTNSVSEQNKQKAGATQPAKSPASVPAAVTEYVQKIKADPTYDWKQPINFYGRVVDESNEPVSNASAHFVWNDLSATGTSEANATSDANGMFSLLNRTGKRLLVSVGKEGYYSSGDARNAAFEYANPADGLFTPDPGNPVVFHLRRKWPGAELVHIARSIRVPRDGSPIYVDLFTGNRVDVGQGQLEVRCLTSSEKDAENRYDWRCSILVPNGGITETTEEFPFEAPTNGYLPKIELDMLKSEPNWHPSIEGQYFLKLQDGNFARLHFEMISYGDHFCTIDCFLNPNGSRNLEPE